MHIHAAHASALGNALAGAQDAETTVSMRRARELRDAAVRLKAASLEIYTNIPQNPETDPQAVAMIGAWSGSQSGGGSLQSSPSIQERSSADLRQQNPSPQIQEVQRTPPIGPVSYWA